MRGNCIIRSASEYRCEYRTFQHPSPIGYCRFTDGNMVVVVVVVVVVVLVVVIVSSIDSIIIIISSSSSIDGSSS